MGVFYAFCFLLVIGTISTALAEEGCAGCPSNRDVNDPEIRGHLTKAVAAQNAKSNEEGVNIVSIKKVSSQVVAGVKYTYDFVGEGQKSKKQYNCHAVIVHQPWINPEPQVMEYSCN